LTQEQTLGTQPVAAGLAVIIDAAFGQLFIACAAFGLFSLV